MRHSAINRGVMRDWIAVAIETGALLPTDANIMDRFGFTGPETARTLLADLADRGDISIRWEGEERIITLGRTKPATMEGAARPVPSVVKKDPGLDEAVDKIKSILGRGRKPVRVEAAAPIAPPPPPPLPAPPPVAQKPSPVAPPTIVVASPAASVARTVKPAERKAVTVNIPIEVYEELYRRAVAGGMMPGTLAAQIVTAAMRGPGKLLVPAAGFRAAQMAGASVHEFASMLIERGLAVHLAESEAAA